MDTLANNIILASLLMICVATDLKERRIPNKVTVTAALLAIVINGLVSGAEGVEFSVTGAIVGGALMYFPYMFGGVGGGDLKMMAAVGAVTGVRIVCASFLFTAIAGGIIVVACSIFSKVAGRSGKFETAACPSRSYHLLIDGSGGIMKEKSAIPYACAIAAGTVAALYFAPALPL